MIAAEPGGGSKRPGSGRNHTATEPDATVNHVSAFARLVVDRQAAADEDLSPTAVAILLTLRHWQPMTVSDLARIAAIRQPSAHRVTTNLATAGLVARQVGAGRNIPLRLTSEGEATADRMQSSRARVVTEVLGPLSADEQRVLGVLSERMLAAATPNRATARHMCRFCDHSICAGPTCPVGTAASEHDRTADQPADRPVG